MGQIIRTEHTGKRECRDVHDSTTSSP